MKWTKTNITTSQGLQFAAIEPVIISASRSTDIPAFHLDWFVERLQKGYTVWTNPFNGTKQYVSFAKTRVVVFWSKNPEPLLPYFAYFDRLGLNYYLHFTLNNYGAELEPEVPPLAQRISCFKQIANIIGIDRLIWRFDPLLITDKNSVEQISAKIVELGNQVAGFTQKLVVSFADIEQYRKVANNLKKHNIEYRQFDNAAIKQIAQALQKANEKWQIQVATCAEPVNLSEFGIKPNKCIDDDLLRTLFAHDRELMTFLDSLTIKKDGGQRKDCHCIPSKDIGMYNTCLHKCLYCYANTSAERVERNWRQVLQIE